VRARACAEFVDNSNGVRFAKPRGSAFNAALRVARCVDMRDDARKRKRDAIAIDEILERFRAWCEDVGIVTNDDALEIRSLKSDDEFADDRRHYAVFAKRAIEIGETLFEIPKSCVLCGKNSRAHGEAVEGARLGGGLALNVVAVGELFGDDETAREAKGFWDGFRAILPRRGERSLPMFWDAELRDELRGTELAAHLSEDDEAFDEDFETCRDALGEETANAMGLTLETFKAAASIAASRAFYVGGEYGECLVPCADLFNHRTGTNSVAVYGVEDDDDSDDSDGGDSGDTLVIKAVAEAKAGEELFNTFGEQSNASLLHKYGFCEFHNEDNVTVNLDVSLFEDVYGREKMHAVYDAMKVSLQSAEEERKQSLLDFFEAGKYYEITGANGVEDEFFALVEKIKDALVEVENKKVETNDVFEAIIDARLARYGAEAEDTIDEGGRPPAGGGVVGRQAAKLVRLQEMRLLNRVRQ
jgi:SET domain-containing protein 6